MLIVIIAQLIYSNCLSQGTFVKIISDSTDKLPGTIIEDSVGNLIVSLCNDNTVDLIKIGSQGDIIDSVKISPPSGRVWLSTLLEADGNTFYAFGCKEDVDDSLWIVRFNNNLNIILDTCYQIIGYPDFKYIHSIWNSRGNIVIGCVVYDTLDNGRLLLFELNSDGSLIQKKDLGNPNAGFVSLYSLVEINPLEYEIITDRLYNKVFAQYAVLDSSFSVINSSNILWVTQVPSTTIVLNKQQMITSGRKLNFNSFTYDACLIKTYKQQFILDTFLTGSPVKEEWPGLHNSLSRYYKNQLFFGVTSGFNLANPYYSTTNNFIMISQVDTMLNLKWQKQYGGDATYVLFSVLATMDGGCAVMASRYDENIQGTYRNVIIIKFDSAGNITGNPHPHLNAESYIIYPNPADDRLWIESDQASQLSKICQVSIVDLTGKEKELIHITKSLSNRIEVPLQGLDVGLYFLRIYLNDGKTLTKKFLIR